MAILAEKWSKANILLTYLPTAIQCLYVIFMHVNAVLVHLNTTNPRQAENLEN